jgi:hypothetical protein
MMEFVMPKMSWEKPIEEEILDFCMKMAQNMERTPVKGTEHYAQAYRTVGKHILQEVELRKSTPTSEGKEDR